TISNGAGSRCRPASSVLAHPERGEPRGVRRRGDRAQRRGACARTDPDGGEADLHRGESTAPRRPRQPLAQSVAVAIGIGYQCRGAEDGKAAAWLPQGPDAAGGVYALTARHSLGFMQGLPDRVLRHLSLLAGDTGGYAVDRLTHCLQTATRAHRDGRDDEYVT